MKSLRNNLVVGVILSLMLNSTAFANPLTDVAEGHLKEAITLIDAFNKNLEDGDSLLSRIQDAAYGKNAVVYPELRALSDGLNQRFKSNSVTLGKLQVLKDADCALALADTSKSVESENARVACYVLRDALGAATDSHGMMVQSLDAINNDMSKYVVVLEALDAAAAKAAAAKAAAAKAAAAKAAALKKTTITCVKGKLTKKVTAVKPICPAGYQKK
jgi:hypothetical protein